MSDDSNSIPGRGMPPDVVELYSPAYLDRRRQAIAASDNAVGFRGVDALDPVLPAGHAYGVRQAVRLTSYTKRHQRKAAMDITPQDVIDVLNAADIRNWVLMGLHGYVGYMPNPRATQDVDIMVPHSGRVKAKKAISTRWPELVIRELSQVTLFLDPLDLDSAGHPKPIIDLMHPWSPFQELILQEHVVVDPETQHRLPTLEAALVSKYAAMISPFRERNRKEYDAGDFRRLVQANRVRIRFDELQRLAGLVWERGAEEIVQFVEIATSDQPFPI